jgi:hypothetical protein
MEANMMDPWGRNERRQFLQQGQGRQDKMRRTIRRRAPHPVRNPPIRPVLEALQADRTARPKTRHGRVLRRPQRHDEVTERQLPVLRSSVKRFASAVGEGAMAATFVHRYLVDG